VRDAQPLASDPDAAIWRVSVRPSAGPAVAAAAGKLGATWFMDWGGGLVWVAAAATEANHAAIGKAADEAHGNWLLFRAPHALRAAVPVVPAEPAPLARMTRGVKAAFDPRGILNPGRIFAGV
jgi:glycolate oxidase FAD binding subunit